MKNGGLLTRAQDFFTDKRAKAFFKQRLAYLAARWGYSPSVFAWEFFNEGEFVLVCEEEGWNSVVYQVGCLFPLLP